MAITAASAWVFAFTTGKPQTVYAIDPTTGVRKVVGVNKHTLFFISPVVWAIIITIGALIVGIPAGLQPSRVVTVESKQTNTFPGQSRFEAANEIINSQAGARAANGNDSVAVEMAQEFGASLADARREGIEKSSVGIFSAKGFQVYCRRAEDRCAFLVHVPDLRKFDAAAKQWMGEVAWQIARQVVSRRGYHPDKLAVGLRGLLSYDRVLTGSGLIAPDGPSMGLKSTREGSDSKQSLYFYFADPPAKAAKSLPAKPTHSSSKGTHASPDPSPKANPPAGEASVAPVQNSPLAPGAALDRE